MTNKVAILTDTHMGARKGSQIFHDYFEKFYAETFFPALDESGIRTVIHLGDCFDVRKGIDYWSLDWAKRVFFTPLQERGINLHLIVGNHDIFYKNTLRINSPGLNLQEFSNIKIYDSPQTSIINNTPVFMIPWICEENAEEFVRERDDSKAKIAMGHLELCGFYANANYQMTHGMDHQTLSQFDSVFSGHYHKKSSSGNIHYLGNTYQLYWNDVDETRGFHFYDLESNELEFVPNPNIMFHKIYLKKGKLINPNKYSMGYVKLIVEDSSDSKELSNLVNQLYRAGVHDVKVIETIDLGVDDDVEIESEDTLTTLANYVNAMDDKINKENVIGIFRSLYIESQEV